MKSTFQTLRGLKLSALSLVFSTSHFCEIAKANPNELSITEVSVEVLECYKSQGYTLDQALKDLYSKGGIGGTGGGWCAQDSTNELAPKGGIGGTGGGCCAQDSIDELAPKGGTGGTGGGC